MLGEVRGCGATQCRMSGAGDDAREDVVGLEIAADEERLRACFREAALGVERDRARVVLPHAEPQSFASGNGFDLTHQTLRDAAAVMAGVDVETRKLDIAPWRRFDADVCVREDVAALLDHEHHALVDLAPLLRFAIRARAIRVHILSAILRGERLAKGALAECGEGGSVSVGGVADSHLQAYDNGMTVATEMTADELLALPDDGSRYELVRGELRKMSPAGTDHGDAAAEIIASLRPYAKRHGLGKAYSEIGFRLRRNPDTVRVPDAAFVRVERLVRGPKYFEGPPDIAFEVVSPSDTYSKVAEKTLEYLRAGTRVVVIVDPNSQSVDVHRDSGSIRVNDVLEIEDVVPGWKLPLADLFA